MSEAVPGYLCKSYLNTATHASPTWSEAKFVKDVALPDSAESIDVSARFSGGKKYEPGQAEQNVTFSYQYIKGSVDSVLSALRTAFHGRTALQMAFADGPIATNGTTYFKDWFKVHKMDSAEDLGGSKMYDIELRPCIHFESSSLIERTYTTVSGS